MEAFKNIRKDFDIDVLKLIYYEIVDDEYYMFRWFTYWNWCSSYISEVCLLHMIKNREFNHSLIKTIKFRENPKPDELVK